MEDCDGSIEDLNQPRISFPATKQLNVYTDCWGARHVFVKPCLELQFDNMGSVKAGKRTNQCILAVEAGEET